MSKPLAGDLFKTPDGVISYPDPQKAAGGDSATTQAKIRLLFRLHDEAKLNREDRLELAGALLRRDVTSFRELEEADVDRLLAGLRYLLNWQHLYRERFS